MALARALRLRVALAFVLACTTMVIAGRARAQVLEVPAGGRVFTLPETKIACDALNEGFETEAGSRLVRPPVAKEAIGQSTELRIADTPAACETESQRVTLVATGAIPIIDSFSSQLSPDEGRFDAKGRDLLGVTISWESRGQHGFDTCRDPRAEGNVERCSWSVSRDVSADPTETVLRMWPHGAAIVENAIIFDDNGRRVPPEKLVISPARVLLTRLVPVDSSVDVASGQGDVPLDHPEAVSSADCGSLHCELSSGKLIVTGVSTSVSHLDVKLRLLPHVYLARKDGFDSQISARYAVLHCPMSIASGPPIRGSDDAKVVVKIEGRCAIDLSSVRFYDDERPLRVLDTVNEETATWVLLRLGNVREDSVAISAVRGGPDGISLAVARAQTRATPPVRASLELPGFPNIGFIPTNRPAIVHPSSAGEHQYFAILPIEGVYEVAQTQTGTWTVKADPNAAGLTQLRFGIRAKGLPIALSNTDLATVIDPLQRNIREANIAAPLEQSVVSAKPLIELVCGGGAEPLTRVVPGVTARLSFSSRDNCRVVFHREWLSVDYGTQKLNFEVDVISPDGVTRPDAKVSEVITLRAGPTPRYAWIRGVLSPFDRAVVRVSHVADENHYIGGAELRTGAPAAQWAIVFGTGRARLYGTTTIPTGLYRFGDRQHSGVLSLNFGVISRLTWLDPEGREGFLGAEAGVLVIGLANSKSESGESLTQVGAVLGIGLAVPIANRASVTQASINLHAWFEANMTDSSDASRYAFIFGPSISIGNVGTNL